MPELKIDNIVYNTEDLSDQGNAILRSLQFLESQLQQLQNEISIYETAQKSYVRLLESEIKSLGLKPMSPKQK